MISRDIANRIYDILMEECGGTEFWRDNFVQTITEEDPSREYRFQGLLGFGGKFRLHRDKWFVDCYQEHENPERLSMIDAANKRLLALFQENQ